MNCENRAAVVAHPIDPILFDALNASETIARLFEFTLAPRTDSHPFPWLDLLSSEDRKRFVRDLKLLLSEPSEMDETLDVPEIADLITEYAHLAGWNGIPIETAPVANSPQYQIDIRSADRRAVDCAPPGVKRAVQSLINGFLSTSPTDPLRIGAHGIKKMPEREIWQIDLPNDYRLRYHADEAARVVYIVYLGPHPSNAADGREKSVVARVHRQRNC